MAQTNDISGQYYLEGVMETASVFKLTADSTFEFFFSYGALDRYGSGKWTPENNNIILNSRPYPGKDFKLVDSASDNTKFITIKIDDKNENFFRFVHCTINTDNGDTMLDANEKAVITLPNKTTGIIHLLFDLCPEKISTFTISNTTQNVFTFRFEPWMMEVFFTNFTLTYQKDHLEGKHPLLTEKDYTYVKDE